MLTQRLKRLRVLWRAFKLRWAIADEEASACNIQAEMMTAPARLIRARARITDLRNRLEELEVSS